MAIKNKFITQANNTDYGHRNLVVNGGFDVWQRGTSFTNMTNPGLTADRWHTARGGWATGITTSKSSSGNINTIRVQRNSGDTSAVALYLGTAFETIEVKKIAGKTVTLSFKALKGSNYSAASSLLSCVVASGTGVDGNNFTANFTGTTNIIYPTVTLSTTLSQYSVTFTIPSNATQLSINFNFTPTGTAGVNDYVEIGDVQLEVGSFATPFERRLYQTELALCQRFYEVSGTNTYLTLENGGVYTQFNLNMNTAHTCKFLVRKRVPPSIRIWRATVANVILVNGSNVSVSSINSNVDAFAFSAGSAGSTTGMYIAEYAFDASADL